MRHTARSQIPHTQSIQDKIAAETDEAKKKELVNEYQQLLWDEMPLVSSTTDILSEFSRRDSRDITHLKAESITRLSGNGL